MSKKIIRGFRTNMTLYSLCLIAFVAVTVPFQPLLAAAEGLVALLVILVGRRRQQDPGLCPPVHGPHLRRYGRRPVKQYALRAAAHAGVR